jgi:2-keto-4-pentenoate hydratase/2-oxohepta-3-ene-1,7-dioic acid hydratase in catechol pathway
MQWARAQKGDGTEVTGVLVGNMLHPRASLGSETATGEAIALGELTLLAPVKPGKFIGLWNNYKAAAEKGGMQHPEHPLYFCKADTSLIGQGGQVVIPPSAGRVIFEGELGVVIGQTCKNITPEQAEDAIFGYTCINDFT